MEGWSGKVSIRVQRWFMMGEIVFARWIGAGLMVRVDLENGLEIQFFEA